ncbi:hypothetical protein CHUAL_006938 [Chamberlinius hualienensis]
MAKVDLQTMQCSEFAPFNRDNVATLRHPIMNINYHVYREHIVILISDLITSRPLKILKINTTTRQMEKCRVELGGSGFIIIIGSCVVEDQLYLFVLKSGGLSVCIADLETFKTTFIEGRNSPVSSNIFMFSTVAYGLNIFCFNIFTPGVFVFHTRSNKWTKLENFGKKISCKAKNQKIFENVVIDDKLFVFSKVVTRKQLTYSRIGTFNLITKRWSSAKFSCPFAIDDSFAGCCVIDNMIVVFKNSAHVMAKLSKVVKLGLGIENDKLEMYGLDLTTFLKLRIYNQSKSSGTSETGKKKLRKMTKRFLDGKREIPKTSMVMLPVSFRRATSDVDNLRLPIKLATEP